MGFSRLTRLKKADIPKKEDFLKRLEKSIEDTSEHVKKLGIKEEDVVDIIHEHRRRKREGSS